MVLQKFIVTVFLYTFFNVFLMAEKSITGDKMNCLCENSKYRPFQGQNTLWKHKFQKEFTDQELETTECKEPNQKCFEGLFSDGSLIKGVCKTRKITITIDIYRTDTGNITSKTVNNVPVGCGCHFTEEKKF